MNIKLSKIFFFMVLFLTILICCWLLVQTVQIAPFPTDSSISYIPAAANLSHLDYISQIHTTGNAPISAVNMYLKENMILGISFFQRLLGDQMSLYPNIALLIFSFFICSVIFFKIFSRQFGLGIAFYVTLVFLSTAWPYIYILLGSHQIFVLMNFLLAFFCLMLAFENMLMFLFFGAFLGLMLFSSPTSIMYIPYFLFVFYFENKKLKELCQNPRKIFLVLLVVVISVGSICFFFMAPNPNKYLKGLMNYKNTVQLGNHFQVYFSQLKDIIAGNLSFRGAGWIWILKYIVLVIPTIFILYISSVFYVLVKARRTIQTIIFIIVSFSTPLLIEFFQFAQFGRNYFSWLFAMLYIIGFALHLFFSNAQVQVNGRLKKLMIGVLFVLLSFHIVSNALIFIKDIFPKRMAVTRMYQWFEQNNVKNIYMFKNHPNTFYTGYMMSYIKNAKQFNVYNLEDGAKSHEGVIVLPPSNTEVIWHNCVAVSLGDDYSQFLNENKILAKFPTILSSRYWTQEEEICTYKDLILKTLDTSQSQNTSILILKH